jgi:predicted MPP superfamily phosphohydrolase
MPAEQTDRAEGNSREKITWLHLSDLHLSAKDGDFSVDKSLRDLKIFIEENKGFCPDLFLITGDLFYSAEDAKYYTDKADSEQFRGLEDLLKLGKDRIFIVPGNHDLNRKIELPHRLLKSNEESNEFFSLKPDSKNREMRKEFLGQFKSFNEFLKKSVGYEFTNDEPYFAKLIPFKFNGEDKNLGIVGLISAWFSKGVDDNGQLWVGERLCCEALEKIRRESDYTIVLQHHPLNWLHDEEFYNIKSEFMKNAQILLTGHKHRNEMELNLNTVGSLITCQAGALHKKGTRSNVALFGTLDLIGNKVDIQAIRNDDDGNGWDKYGKTTTFPLRIKASVPYKVISMKKNEAKHHSSVPRNHKTNYGNERDDWTPYKEKENIKSILNNAASRFNESFKGLNPSLNFKPNASDIDESEEQIANGVIVVDPISLVEDSIKKMFKKNSCKYLHDNNCIIFFVKKSLIENPTFGKEFINSLIKLNKKKNLICEVHSGEGVQELEQRFYSLLLPKAYPRAEYVQKHITDQMYRDTGKTGGIGCAVMGKKGRKS